MKGRSRPAGVMLTDAGGECSAALRAGERAVAGVHAHQRAQRAAENLRRPSVNVTAAGRERFLR